MRSGGSEESLKTRAKRKSEGNAAEPARPETFGENQGCHLKAEPGLRKIGRRIGDAHAMDFDLQFLAPSFLNNFTEKNSGEC
jgi:hypothetical protein